MPSSIDARVLGFTLGHHPRHRTALRAGPGGACRSRGSLGRAHRRRAGGDGERRAAPGAAGPGGGAGGAGARPGDRRRPAGAELSAPAAGGSGLPAGAAPHGASGTLTGPLRHQRVDARLLPRPARPLAGVAGRTFGQRRAGAADDRAARDRRLVVRARGTGRVPAAADGLASGGLAGREPGLLRDDGHPGAAADGASKRRGPARRARRDDRESYARRSRSGPTATRWGSGCCWAVATSTRSGARWSAWSATSGTGASRRRPARRCTCPTPSSRRAPAPANARSTS